MRDPDGYLTLTSTQAIREVHRDSSALTFLHSDVAKELVAQRAIVEYTFVTDTILHSPRLPFVSYPSEWCAAQLQDAAALTLRISQAILTDRWELKDASAWNVIFDGTQPVLCDHLSFKPIDMNAWWAMGQFCRHFTFPLLLDRSDYFTVAELHGLFHDGVDAKRTASILGAKRFFSKVTPLLWQSGNPPGFTRWIAQHGSDKYQHTQEYLRIPCVVIADGARAQTLHLVTLCE